MSFMGYVQSLWSPAAPAVSSSSGGLVSDSTAHSNNSGGSAQHLGSGVWPLSAQVREEMKRGTRYNMKVILRGTKGTGKSTLLARLTSHPLPISYTPSTELVASTMRLQGEHCAPHEGIKVDIWEVVEEGRQRSASSSSPNVTAKMTRHIPSAQLQEALRVAADARLRDVYAGAYLTIFMIDPRQRASWEYAKQESLHVPPTCCVLYALNFSDATTATNIASLSLEVQTWCKRMRRATTSMVHRMLEGRQASQEFSVRPMTAVLSALSGAGIMGVIRALHVSSTLLRIATEEVRIGRLFELMARQQAVSISDDTASTAGPILKAAFTAGNGVVEQKETNTGEASVHRAAGYQRHSSTQHSVNEYGGDPSPAVPQQSDKSSPPLGTDAANALLMEHRKTASSSVVLGNKPFALPHQQSDTMPPLSLTEAEAMKFFLGSSNSGESNTSGRPSRASSSSSSSASITAGRRFNDSITAASRARGVLDTSQRPSSPPTDASPLSLVLPSSQATISGDHVVESSAVPGPLNYVEDDAVEPTTDTAGRTSSSTVVHTARPPDEEAVRSLVATMVHDAEVPAGDFFQEDGASGSEQAAGPAFPSVMPTAVRTSSPSATTSSSLGDNDGPRNDSLATVSQKMGNGLRARPLSTHRVVRKASTAPLLRPVADVTPPVLQKEVSAILAEMTAALSASVPQESNGADDLQREAEDTHPTDEDNTGEAAGEMRKKKKSSKHHRSATDSASGRHEHGDHRKHRNRRSAANGQHDGQVVAVEDDGSFELVVT